MKDTNWQHELIGCFECDFVGPIGICQLEPSGDDYEINCPRCLCHLSTVEPLWKSQWFICDCGFEGAGKDFDSFTDEDDSDSVEIYCPNCSSEVAYIDDVEFGT